MQKIRHVTPSDLPGLLKLEESWPEGERAAAEQLQSRIERFPQGFLVYPDPDHSGEFLASLTSCPIVYDPAHPERISSWNHATCDGLIPENSAEMKTDTLYLVSSVVSIPHRGGGIYTNLITDYIRRTRELGFKRILTGAVMPGYDSYCKKYGEIPAGDYGLLQRHGMPLDPFLRVLAKLGFHLPDAAHVIENYYPDEPSRCYAALLVCELD